MSMLKKKDTVLSYLVNTVLVALIATAVCLLTTKTADIKLVWTCCVFVIMAVSLNITMGFMGQLALGHCGFMAVGAYTSTLIANLLKDAGLFKSAASDMYIVVFLIGLVAGGIAAALIGLVVGAPALRLRGDYLAIITLGFGLIIKSVLDNIASPTLYANDCNMYIADKLKGDFLWIILLVTILCVALMATFIRSKYGRMLKSIRDDDIAASACGINTSRYKIMGFTLSAFFAGIAGVLYAAMMSSLSTSSFDFASSNIQNSIFIVVMVVVGGMGSITGSVVTGAGMVLLNNLISAIPESSPLYFVGQYPMLLYALALVVVIMFFPRGIFGSHEFSLLGSVRAVGKWLKKRKTGGAE